MKEADDQKVGETQVSSISGGTAQTLLQISLQEDELRNSLQQIDKEIRHLEMVLIRTQNELQAKMVLRDQVTTSSSSECTENVFFLGEMLCLLTVPVFNVQLCNREAELRSERMNILRGMLFCCN